MPLAGLRVISLESRKQRDMELLVSKEGGTVFIAPSVREQPDDDAEARRLLEALERGDVDMVIFMTGTGLTFMRNMLGSDEPRLGEALRSVTVVARGPKPVGVLRSMNVPVHVTIPEPNTWREVAEAVLARSERRIAIQEHGRPNEELYQALRAAGREVTPVTVYRWELPKDTEPLREAARMVANGECDVIFFTSSAQLDHLLGIAAETAAENRVIERLRTYVAVASIGPMMSEALLARGIQPDIVPAHPKMWDLVRTASEQAAGVIARKRSSA